MTPSRYAPRTLEIEEYDSSLIPRQQALLHRSSLFAYINHIVQDAKFCEAVILLRRMAKPRGINGGALGYLSSTIIELIACRYYHDRHDHAGFDGGVLPFMFARASSIYADWNGASTEMTPRDGATSRFSKSSIRSNVPERSQPS